MVEPVIHEVIGIGELDEGKPVGVGEGDEVKSLVVYVGFADGHSLCGVALHELLSGNIVQDTDFFRHQQVENTRYLFIALQPHKSPVLWFPM